MYSILNETGNEWSDLRMGVMWSCLQTLNRILAVLFWMSLKGQMGVHCNTQGGG